MRNKGFTLVELIVVIAIIAVLAAIIAPNAFKAVEKAKVSGEIEDYRSIKTAAMAYYADTGTWPAQCVAPPCNAGFVTDPPVTGWDGPYLEKWPATAKWGGDVQWCLVTTAANGICEAWDGDIAQERVVRIEDVPQTAATKVDQQLDGAINNATGSVRYTAAATTILRVLVSED